MGGPGQKVDRGARIAPPLEESALPGFSGAGADTSQTLMTELRKELEELRAFTSNPGAIHEGTEKQVVALIQSLSAKAKIAGLETEVGDLIGAIKTELKPVLMAKTEAISSLGIYSAEVRIIAELARGYREGKEAA